MKMYGILCACLVGLSGYADGKPFISSLSVGFGQSLDSVDIYRLGVRKDSACRALANRTGWLSGYYEASLHDWKKGGDEIYGGAVSPVLVYYFGAPANALHPYIEVGIGAAFISDTQIEGRDLSTNFQFEDRIGVGLRTDRADFNVRYMHYSNGGIKEPNAGIDIFIVTAGYRL